MRDNGLDPMKSFIFRCLIRNKRCEMVGIEVTAKKESHRHQKSNEDWKQKLHRLVGNHIDDAKDDQAYELA